jgi:hypothetical protein
MKVEFEGAVHEFPDDASDTEVAAALSAAHPAPPRVPISGLENVPPEQIAAGNAAYDAEQKRFKGSPTAMGRIADTASFLGSLPVRAVTGGEYGLGDIARNVSEFATKHYGVEPGAPGAGNPIAEGEQRFVQANPGLMEGAKAVGDIAMGIPGVGELGAVPGQMTRSIAASARAPVSAIKQGVKDVAGAYAEPLGQLMRDEGGMARLPGGPLPPPSESPPVIYATQADVDSGALQRAGIQDINQPPGQPPAQTPPARRFVNRRIPSGTDTPQVPAVTPPPPPPVGRDQIIAAGQRLDVPIMEAVAGGPMKQKLAGALAGLPYAGDPVARGFQRGVGKLGEAFERGVSNLGTPGSEAAGAGASHGILDWIENGSTKILDDAYAPVTKLINPEVTAPLTRSAGVVQRLLDEMKASSGTAGLPVVKMLEEAVTRPQGLTYSGLKNLRTEIGGAIDAAALTKDPASGALKMAYRGLTQDLRGAVRKAGGRQALKAFDEANAKAAEIAGLRQELMAVIGKRGDVAPGAVISRIQAMASDRGTNARRLALVLDKMGPEARGNIAAEILDRMGKKDAGSEFSHDRFATAYGKMSEQGKQMLFGPVLGHLDDINALSKKFGELSKRFNHSNTGAVNFIMKLATSPQTLFTGAVTAGMTGGASLIPSAIGGGAALGLRRVSHALARPAVAGRAVSVGRAFYNLEADTLYGRGTRAIAKREAELDAAVKAYSRTMGRELDYDPAKLEANIRRDIAKLRSSRATGE